MASKREKRQAVSVKVTPDNYQVVLLEVLKNKNHKTLQLLAQGAARAGIADAEAISKVSDTQWEAMLHKLRSIHPQLTKEEREESYDWCVRHGVFPGGNFEHDTKIKKL